MSHSFPVEISARHLHITDEHLAILFGEGATLTHKKDLSQPGQYACAERVTVRGPKGEIPGVSILGPTRPATQLELSLTDARKIGITPPVRESGDVAGSPGCVLVGPCGEVEISEGVIAAKRHIHMRPEDAAALGVANQDVVFVKVASPDRTTIFGDVVVRVHESFALAMHVDTDEANAAAPAPGASFGEIVRL